MADAGIFIGWGAPVRGREAKGLEIFTEAMEYWRGRQVENDIESFEAAVLDPHGGDLYGFILVRGTEQQLSDLRSREDFERLNVRAGMTVERLGIVSASLGDNLAGALDLYAEAVREIAP